MAGYTPLFNSIVMSSIWQETNCTRIVWITMLASSDAYGRVEASIIGLARAANVSLDECKTAINVLESPDIHSRNQDNEGRRIEKIDGGWIVLNYVKYREKAKERNADWWKEYRKDRKDTGKPIKYDTYHNNITTNHNISQQSATNHNNITTTETETETQTETDTEKEHIQKKKQKESYAFKPPSIDDINLYCKEINFLLDASHFIDFYASKGWMIGKNKMKDWRAAVRTWQKRTPVPVHKETEFEAYERMVKEGKYEH
jgi:hypothetical protein